MSCAALQEVCYCDSNIFEEYMITCSSCRRQFHTKCLKSGRPSPLAGDIYFSFTCEACSPHGNEIIRRMKLQWTLVIMLALYNLQLEGTGKCGYFRWREHICRYIDKHWSILFGSDRKKSATWHGTVAGALSTGANRFFISGFDVLHETGWWTLKSSKMPAIDELDSIALNLKANRKRKSPEKEEVLMEGSRRKNQNIVEAAVMLKEKKSRIAISESKPMKIKLETKSRRDDASIFPPNHKLKLIVASSSSSFPANDEEDTSGIVIKKERSSPTPSFQDEDSNLWSKDLNLDMPHMYDMPCDLEMPSSFLDNMATDDNEETLPSIKQESESEEESSPDKTPGTPRKAFPDTSRKRTVITKEESPVKEVVSIELKFDLMSPYEEESVLQKLEGHPVAMSNCVKLRQLYRKLVVRKLKREQNIPVFDIDVKLRLLRGMDPPDYVNSMSQNKMSVSVSQTPTIFDRYQTTPNYLLSGPQKQISFATRLMGKRMEDQESIVSPYSGRILKPFIFRDYKTKPLKLKLLEELVSHVRKKNGDLTPVEQFPIDYCYVRPEFIPAINALCHEFFWPGIDMSECLQYPDFSCVALYRKVIVGFAFMVPDASYNEAYITFIFCHPEWRRSGIATFMLYHLIQTCMGKDITLHVSATSSAVFLYQNFSFKIEEFIQDFYDKYLPADSKECRHALFLRLSH